MSHYLHLVVASIASIVLSCNQPEGFNKVAIEVIYSDSVSVRAIVPIDTGQVWFAGNRGKVGLIQQGKANVITITHEGKALQFRALAYQNETAFALSIDNPGLLYRIKHKDDEIKSVDLTYKEEGQGVFYDAMVFWNDQEGLAIGDPLSGCLSVIKTQDGGVTWNKSACDDLPSMNEGEAAFAASNGNIAVFNDRTWVVTGGKRARVFYSPDKGVRWEAFQTPIVQGDVMTGIFSVDFYDENLGVVFGGDWSDPERNTQNKAITKDAGKTWTLMAEGQAPGYCSSVRFVPQSKGKGMVAVGPNGTYSSFDQGQSWNHLDKTPFYALRFVNDTLAYASGANIIARLTFYRGE